MKPDPLYQSVMNALSNPEHRQYVDDLHRRAQTNGQAHATSAGLNRRVADLEAAVGNLRQGLRDSRIDQQQATAHNASNGRSRVKSEVEDGNGNGSGNNLTPGPNLNGPVHVPLSTVKADPEAALTVDDSGVIDLTLTDEEDTSTETFTDANQGKRPETLVASSAQPRPTKQVIRNATPGPGPTTGAHLGNKRPADVVDDSFTNELPVKRSKSNLDSVGASTILPPGPTEGMFTEPDIDAADDDVGNGLTGVVERSPVASMTNADTRKTIDTAELEDDDEPRPRLAKCPRSSSSSPDAQGSDSTIASDVKDVKKLNVRNLIECPAISTIWDDFCNLELAPIEHEGVEYEIGDLVVYRNNWKDEKNGRIPEMSRRLPYAWTGVLCDYSTQDPFTTKGDGTRAYPLYTEDAPVEHVAIMWIFSQLDIRTTIAGKVLKHEDVKVTDEDDFMETFLGDTVPKNKRFFTTELEWMGIWDLCSHLKPTDVGCTDDSRRAMILNWAGPVVDHQEEWRQSKPKSKGRTLRRIYSLKEETGLRENDLPEGWVQE